MWTFVGKVMCLLFNTLSSFVIAFFPRSKCLYRNKNDYKKEQLYTKKLDNLDERKIPRIQTSQY